MAFSRQLLLQKAPSEIFEKGSEYDYLTRIVAAIN